MPTHVERRTVDLSSYSDLVVIYLGMRVNRITGIKTLLGFGPKISASAAARPDGLLRHENIIYSLFRMHIGMRQYWRDLDSLMQWTRSEPHRQWWQGFLKEATAKWAIDECGRRGQAVRRRPAGDPAGVRATCGHRRAGR